MNHDSLEACIRDAGLRGASDLSFEPDDERGLLVVARIDGVRVPCGRIAAPAAGPVLARMKALAQLPAYITDEAQDGSLDGRPFGVPGDLRVSFLPTVRGQRAAMRLPAIGALPSPEGLGLPETVVARLRQLVRRPDGMLLVVGPTGSGKTTTMHSLITELAHERGDRHVLSIEDPVERRLPGITQVEIALQRGFGFPEALAACLRHDPDVIVVGEVRDPATAQACVRAALTGHLVLTTVHAGRAHEAVPRLLEMGVDADLLLPALRGVMAQRLVRRRHGPCRGEGCGRCTEGYSGRHALADLLLMDGEARTLLRNGGHPALVADLDQQAAALAEQGITTLSEIARVMG